MLLVKERQVAVGGLQLLGTDLSRVVLVNRLESVSCVAHDSELLIKIIHQ